MTAKEKEKITTKIIVNDKKSDTLGSVKVLLNDKVIHEEVIYKKENIKGERKSIFKKIGGFFKNMFNF